LAGIGEQRCGTVPFPNSATQFQPGNRGKPKGAAPISKRRARRLLKQAIIAEAASRHMADFDGDGLSYLRAVYRGEVKPDPLRMQAAATATRFEKPSLSASLTATVANASASAPIGIVMLPPKDTDDE
jgi:hypothetical protein